MNLQGSIIFLCSREPRKKIKDRRKFQVNHKYFLPFVQDEESQSTGSRRCCARRCNLWLWGP